MLTTEVLFAVVKIVETETEGEREGERRNVLTLRKIGDQRPSIPVKSAAPLPRM